MTRDELAEIKKRCAIATAGPWHVRHLDDDQAMNLIAVSTKLDREDGPRWPDFDHREIVAATLVQGPCRYVDIVDGCWEENAQFIAHAREDVPNLIAEVERLRQMLEGDTQDTVS